jgi:hypothetical protein
LEVVFSRCSAAAKAVYQALRPVKRLGNMMVAVVVKADGDTTRGSGL